MSARLRVCSSRALSRLRALFHVGVWCLDPGTHVLSFGHVTGFGHSRSIFCHRVSARSRVRSAPRTLVHVCFVVARSSCFYRLRAFMLYLVLCGTQLVYSLAACFHVVMSCVNTWLMSFLISCVFMSCSFAPFIISLCLQFRVGSLPYVGLSMSCLVQSSQSASLPVCFSPPWGSFCLFCLSLLLKVLV